MGSAAAKLTDKTDFGTIDTSEVLKCSQDADQQPFTQEKPLRYGWILENMVFNLPTRCWEKGNSAAMLGGMKISAGSVHHTLLFVSKIVSK